MAGYPSATTIQTPKVTGANVETKAAHQQIRKYRVNLADASVSAATATDNINVVPIYAGEAIVRGWLRTITPSTTASSVLGVGLGTDTTGNLTGAAKTTSATSAANTYVALSGTPIGAVQAADTFVEICHGTTKALDGIFEIIVVVAEVTPQ